MNVIRIKKLFHKAKKNFAKAVFSELGAWYSPSQEKAYLQVYCKSDKELTAKQQRFIKRFENACREFGCESEIMYFMDALGDEFGDGTE